MWPRPLPDEKTVKLLDALEAVICASESLTAHQALRSAHTFNEARGLPAIGPEPVVLRQPQSARLRRLRAHGLTLIRPAERLHGEDATLRKGYVRHFIDRVEVGDGEIKIAGPEAALAEGILASAANGGGVPRFVREWWTNQDKSGHWILAIPRGQARSRTAK
jgi:hypothetical protein